MCRKVQHHACVGSPMADILQHGLEPHLFFWDNADAPFLTAAADEQRNKVATSADTTSEQPNPLLNRDARQLRPEHHNRLLYGNFTGNALVAAAKAQQCEAQQTMLPPEHNHQQQAPTPAMSSSTQHSLHTGQQQYNEHCSRASNSSRHQAISAGAAAAPAAAACPRAIGRWCGAVAVMDSQQYGSQDSDAGTGPALQCDEVLVSMDTAADDDQHLSHMQQQQRDRVVAAEAAWPSSWGQAAAADPCVLPGNASESDSESDDDDADAAQQQAAAASLALVLQALDRAACTRSGRCVLTATAAHAAACGAASVRPRLLITEVSVYLRNAACSRRALEQANSLMASMTLPDGATYMPVSPDSLLFKAGAAWQFPAFVVCLGSSYMQRILERLPQLADAALACPGFENYCSHLNNRPLTLPPRLSGQDAAACLATLRSVLFTCLFLALKVADQVHAMGLLRFMLSHLSSGGVVVSLSEAANVEARCLEALAWRLGPFFAEDTLPGNDEALWAAGMGHWEYGSEAEAATD